MPVSGEQQYYNRYAARKKNKSFSPAPNPLGKAYNSVALLFYKQNFSLVNAAPFC